MTKTSRRDFFTKTAKGVGFAALCSVLWGIRVKDAKSNVFSLRPPGAEDEKHFLATCIRCGMCVTACPYDTLKLAEPGNNIPLGTPYFEPRDIPCFMCEDIPCVDVCPSGALEKEKVTKTEGDGKTVYAIEKSRMGIAVIDDNSCIAFWGIQCDACYRACPLIGDAISVRMERNKRTGKHAFLVPVVHADACTGCGMCEKACVTKKPAIRIVPDKYARGEVDTNYVKGWDENDETRLQGISTDKKDLTTETKRSEKSAVDYLNSGGLLDD